MSTVVVLEGFGVFAHVPDVSALVLRVIVKGVFDQNVVFPGASADGAHGDAGDYFRLKGDEILITFGGGFSGVGIMCGSAAVEGGAGDEREVRIVDRCTGRKI